MKTIILITVFVLSTSLYSQERMKTPAVPTASISDNCKLNFDKLKPVFIQDASLYASMTSPVKDTRLRSVKQGVVLKNGTEIRMVKSGCAHYLYMINIRPKNVKSFDPQYLYELAIENLKLIPVEKDEEFNIKLMTNALDKKNYPIVTQVQDLYTPKCIDGAVCSMRLWRNTASGGSEIELTYDIAL